MAIIALITHKLPKFKKKLMKFLSSLLSSLSYSMTLEAIKKQLGQLLTR